MASFEQNQKNKLWSVRFRIVKNGKTIQKRLSGFRTKKEAEAAHIKFINDIPNINLKTDVKKIKFEEVYKEYCLYKKSQLKESSYIDLKSKMNNHVLPYFKNKFIDEISPKEILAWQLSLSEKYSYKYKCCIRKYFSNMLKYIELYYDIRSNIYKVENFRNLEQKKEMQVWSLEEFKKFINKVDDIKFKTYFSFLYLTGCRKGESLALSWNDIDFNNKIVKFNKSVTRKAEGCPWLVTTTKNVYSIRNIALPDTLIDLLRNYKEWQQSQYNEINFVFGDKVPLSDKKIDRMFEKYCKEAEVKKIRIHDLRHSHASFLISEGVSIVAVAKRLGHKDIEQTLNTYSHLMPQDNELLLKKLSFAI